MNDPTPLLDRAGIEEAFRRLGDRLARRGVVADLYVFGGAAMALAYDSRRATRTRPARWWLNEFAAGTAPATACARVQAVLGEQRAASQDPGDNQDR